MSEYGFAHDTKDVDWIKQLGADNDVWIVITGDHRIRRNLAERTAWIKAGLKAFVLANAYQKTPVHQCASVLLWRWPEMRTFISSAATGSMFELPINRHSGFVPLAVN
jgi:phosphoglycerol transferase MdoB-like AlkP superfamily enzyme